MPRTSTGLRPTRSETNPAAGVVVGRGPLVLGLLSGKIDLAEARSRGLVVTGNVKALDRVIGKLGPA